MTRHHQNNAGYDFNYTDKLGRDFSNAARHSSWSLLRSIC